MLMLFFRQVILRYCWNYFVLTLKCSLYKISKLNASHTIVKDLLSHDFEGQNLKGKHLFINMV